MITWSSCIADQYTCGFTCIHTVVSRVWGTPATCNNQQVPKTAGYIYWNKDTSKGTHHQPPGRRTRLSCGCQSQVTVKYHANKLVESSMWRVITDSNIHHKLWIWMVFLVSWHRQHRNHRACMGNTTCWLWLDQQSVVSADVQIPTRLVEHRRLFRHTQVSLFDSAYITS